MSVQLEAFVGDLLLTYTDHDHMDIDGSDFQDLLVKHGLMVEAEITAAECEEPWAQEWGYEPGDTFCRYTPLCKELMARARK